MQEHLLFVYQGPTSYIRDAAWSPDGKYIACAAADGPILLLDANTGAVLQMYETYPYEYALALTWFPDSCQFVTCHKKGQVIHWERTSGEKRFLYQSGGGNDEENIFLFSTLSPDGSVLAISGAEDDICVQMLSLKTAMIAGSFVSKPFDAYQQELFELGLPVSNPFFQALAWSPDGHLLALGQDYKVHVWRYETDEMIASYSSTMKNEDGNGQIICCIAWSPDGQFLALTGEDCIEIWTVEGKEKIASYHGHEKYMYNCQWLPGGKHLLSISSTSIHLWTPGMIEGLSRPIPYFLREDQPVTIVGAHLSPDFTKVLFLGHEYLSNGDEESYVWVWEHGIPLP